MNVTKWICTNLRISFGDRTNVALLQSYDGSTPLGYPDQYVNLAELPVNGSKVLEVHGTSATLYDFSTVTDDGNYFPAGAITFGSTETITELFNASV